MNDKSILLVEDNRREVLRPRALRKFKIVNEVVVANKSDFKGSP